MRVPEITVLAEECEAAEATLRQVPDGAWQGPGLGEWTLHELAVHLSNGVQRLSTYLKQGTEATEPVHDRVSYFRYDAAKVAPGVAARAREAAADIPAAQVPDRFAQIWRASVERAAAAPPVALMPTPFGPMSVREYTATRVLEAVVHHMDLRRALELPPAPTPEAARMAMALLEGLLDGPRPRNFGRDRFILAATGRIQVDDPRFPVLG